MKKVIIFLFISCFLYAEMEKIDGYIDIPSGSLPKQGMYINLSGGYELGTVPEDINKYNINAAINLVFPRFEGALSYYKIQDWTLDIKYLLFSRNVYSASIGIDRITYRKYITPFGGGNETNTGYLDEQYKTRPQEWFSLYFVNTYKPSELIELTLGIGRGRYVGYGPRSRYFNLDYLLVKNDTSGYHQDIVFGLFGGLKVKILPYVSGIIEFDGRDVNAGLGVNINGYYFNLCLTKIEQISDILDRNVRFNFSVGGKIYAMNEVKKGILLIRIYDEETKFPIQCAIEMINTKTGKIKTFDTNQEGILQITIEEGTYKITFKNEKYLKKSGTVNIMKDKKIDIKIGLKKLQSPEEILVENKLKEVEDFINLGKLKEANDLINECMKILPGYGKTVTLQKKLKDIIKTKVDSLNVLVIQYENTNPSISLKLLEEILTITPNDETIKVRMDSLKLKIASLTTQKPETKQDKPKTQEQPKPQDKPKTTQPQKPSQEELNNWYKEAINLYLQGKYKEAKALLEKILKYNPNNDKAKKYLEKVKEKL